MCRIYLFEFFFVILILQWQNYYYFPHWDVKTKCQICQRIASGGWWMFRCVRFLESALALKNCEWRCLHLVEVDMLSGGLEKMSIFTRRRCFGSSDSIFMLIYCTFFISFSLSSLRDVMQLSPVQLLSPLTSDLSWPHTPAQMVFPKINHGFLSADQQLIKRRLIKVVLFLSHCSARRGFSSLAHHVLSIL